MPGETEKLAVLQKSTKAGQEKLDQYKRAVAADMSNEEMVDPKRPGTKSEPTPADSKAKIENKVQAGCDPQCGGGVCEDCAVHEIRDEYKRFAEFKAQRALERGDKTAPRTPADPRASAILERIRSGNNPIIPGKDVVQIGAIKRTDENRLQPADFKKADQKPPFTPERPAPQNTERKFDPLKSAPATPPPNPAQNRGPVERPKIPVPDVRQPIPVQNADPRFIRNLQTTQYQAPQAQQTPNRPDVRPQDSSKIERPVVQNNPAAQKNIAPQPESRPAPFFMRPTEQQLKIEVKQSVQPSTGTEPRNLLRQETAPLVKINSLIDRSIEQANHLLKALASKEAATTNVVSGRHVEKYNQLERAVTFLQRQKLERSSSSNKETVGRAHNSVKRTESLGSSEKIAPERIRRIKKSLLELKGRVSRALEKSSLETRQFHRRRGGASEIKSAGRVLETAFQRTVVEKAKLAINGKSSEIKRGSPATLRSAAKRSVKASETRSEKITVNQARPGIRSEREAILKASSNGLSQNRLFRKRERSRPEVQSSIRGRELERGTALAKDRSPKSVIKRRPQAAREKEFTGKLALKNVRKVPKNELDKKDITIERARMAAGRLSSRLKAAVIKIIPPALVKNIESASRLIAHAANNPIPPLKNIPVVSRVRSAVRRGIDLLFKAVTGRQRVRVHIKGRRKLDSKLKIEAKKLRKAKKERVMEAARQLRQIFDLELLLASIAKEKLKLKKLRQSLKSLILSSKIPVVQSDELLTKIENLSERELLLLMEELLESAQNMRGQESYDAVPKIRDSNAAIG